MRRGRALLLAWAAVGLLGADCGGGSGSGGSPARIRVESDAAGCTPLASEFPPGLDLVPGEPDSLLVVNDAPAALVRFDADPSPPQIASPSPILGLPPDSDGDGRADDAFPPFLAPVLDGVLALGPELALMTASGYDQVLFVDPEDGSLVSGTVGVPAGLDPSDYPRLPASSASRTAVSTFVCVRPPPGSTDHFGDALPPAGCDPDAPSFFANTTSGAAVAADRLFVSTSNLGARPGTDNTQFLPGTVLVYDFSVDASGSPSASPDPVAPVIFTEGFNLTQVTAFATPGNPDRPFVLVSATGALQLIADDPRTPEIESGGFPDSPAAIEVIDADALQVVARIPLGDAALSFDRLAIDASGTVAFTGSAVARELFAIDLRALDAIPDPADAVPPVVLDGSDPRVGNLDARIFDADAPLRIPRRPGGPPAATCAGFTPGTGFALDARLLASEFCDGTLSIVESVLSVAPGMVPPEIPLDPDLFRVTRSLEVAAPLVPESLGEPQQPGTLRVRTDGSGSNDVFYLLGTGELCSLRSADF